MVADLDPNSRAGYPSPRYPVHPDNNSSEPRREVPLHNGMGMAVLHPVMGYYMGTEGIDTFYYTANFILTRPEIVYKKVYTSYITDFKFESNSDCELDPIHMQDLFFRLIRKKELKHFLDDTLKKVELERVWVIDNPARSLVTFYEIWDFEKNLIRFGPKVRTEFDYQEDSYNKLIPLMEYELSYEDYDEQALLAAFGIYPDDFERQSLLYHAVDQKIERIFETCTRPQWEIKNAGFQNYPTLLCVDRHRYLKLYGDLKNKHFEQLIQLWITHEETTDYQKYVPEDLHIATYLECLQSNPKSPIKFGKKFVDLGCGNGLLTHILTQSGWSGYGVDARKRNLWEHFCSEGADLEELTVAYKTPLRDVDSETILIGNHPDELCPLIPLLTRQSGAGGFIIIPCCAFDVFGNKFNRATAAYSVYESHFRSLLTMCTSLGFDVKVDKLRIPSTKRLVILGTLRTREPLEGEPDQNTSQEAFEEIMRDLDANQPSIRPPRETNQKVNNCTQLCRGTCESIIEDLFDCIYFSVCKDCPSCHQINLFGERPKWHVGCEKVTIGMLASILPESRLQFLKNQGKGLQTLIKNYSDVFTIEKEFVRVHCPQGDHVQKIVAKGKEKKLRKKPCFFYFRHIDGCPLKNDECAFSHDAPLTTVTVTIKPMPKFAFFEGQAKPILEPVDPDLVDTPETSDDELGWGELEIGIPDFENDFAFGPTFIF